MYLLRFLSSRRGVSGLETDQTEQRLNRFGSLIYIIVREELRFQSETQDEADSCVRVED